MAATVYVLAIDLGTSGVKVGIFDPDGRLVARARMAYKTLRPRPGWVEQEPDSWWRACVTAVREAAGQGDSSNLRALCVTGLAPTLVSVDEHGQVLGPSPIWSDCRATVEVRTLAEGL